LVSALSYAMPLQILLLHNFRRACLAARGKNPSRHVTSNMF
jgi:hypothetical protein